MGPGAPKSFKEFSTRRACWWIFAGHPPSDNVQRRDLRIWCAATFFHISGIGNSVRPEWEFLRQRRLRDVSHFVHKCGQSVIHLRRVEQRRAKWPMTSDVPRFRASRASVQPLARTSPMALSFSMGCSVPQDPRLRWPYPSFCTPPSGLNLQHTVTSKLWRGIGRCGCPGRRPRPQATPRQRSSRHPIRLPARDR